MAAVIVSSRCQRSVLDVTQQKKKSTMVRFWLLGGQKIGPPLPNQALRTSCIDRSTGKGISTSLDTHRQLSMSKTCVLLLHIKT
jgi:hypothetical protein